jgi:methanethiol S-methyltransferase
MTTRVLTFLYGALSYAIFFATFLYAVGFVGNFAVPKSMDSASTGSLQFAFLVDLGLLALFAAQHSVMARPAFKRAVTRILPDTVERSTYVLASSAALLFLFWLWRPLGGVSGTSKVWPGEWRFTGGSARAGCWCCGPHSPSVTLICLVCGRFGGIFWGSHR